MTPEEIADHLAKILSKPLPKKVVKKKPKSTTRGKYVKKAPKPTPLDPNLTVKLRGFHRINGFPYGPGTITVPRELGLVLQEADQRACQYDDSWQQPKAMIIGAPQGQSGHKATRVSPGMFDSPSLEIPEMGTASNDGYSTN